MKNQHGYTYISVLIIVFALGLAAQSTWIPQSTTIRRDKETELVFRGLAYRAAIERYFTAGGDVPTYPRDLGSLLKDPRDPSRRYIRQLYAAPLGNARWVLIHAPQGGISGVAVDSRDTPLKSSGFPAVISHFAQAQSYADWEFVFSPGSAKE